MGLLDAIFHDIEPTEYIELRLIGRDRSGRHVFFKTPLEVMQAVAETKDQHCFFGAAPRRSSTSGTKQSVSRVTVLWSDVDAKNFNNSKALAISSIAKFILPPSFLIDSGHGFHAYWLLKSACTVEEAEVLLKGIRDLVGGDAVTDASRVMRIPGTLNIKDDTPVECRVVTERADLRYSSDDITAATQVSVETSRRVATGDVEGYKSRSERDWGVVRELTTRGVSREAIKAIFRYQPIGDKYKDAGDSYLDHTLDNAAQREGFSVAEGLPAGSAFYEVGDTWWIVSSKGKRQVSTYVFEPRRLLETERGDILFGDVRADGFEWHDVSFPRDAFTRIDTLTKKLGLASWQWLGTDKDVRYLLPYLVDRWKVRGRQKARGVATIGRHGDLWVWEGGSVAKDGALDNYTSPIVFINPSRVRVQTRYHLAEVDDNFRALLKMVASLLPKINLPEVIWPVIGWFMATPLKPIFEHQSIRFPALDLYGTRGSGKSSTVLQVMLPLMGSKDVPAHSHDCSTTPFVLLTLLASANAVPVSLGEYRQSSIAARTFENLRRAMLLAYDVGIDARGRPDQTTTEYPLSAPFVVDGEDALGDAALLERSIVVNLAPETIAINSPCWTAFADLVKLPLGSIAGRYVQFTLGYDEARLNMLWEKRYQDVGNAFTRTMSTRVRRNLALVMTGIDVFVQFLQTHGVEINDPGTPVLAMVLDQVSREALGRTLMLIDEFTTDVVNEVAQAQLSAGFQYTYDKTDNVLWVQLQPTLNWWYGLRRRIGRDVLQAAAIQRQLKERVVAAAFEPGQYIVAPKARNLEGRTAWMHGIDLAAAFKSGLDVPDKLSLKQVTLTFRDGDISERRTSTEVRHESNG